MSAQTTGTSTILPADFDIDAGNEPWSPDAYLIVPLETTQMLMFESAAILGVEAFLKIADLPYKVVEKHNASAISPNGKLPVLRCGPYVVSEMEGVVQLASTKNISLTNRLTAAEKADLRAYMSLVHNVLGNALLYYCWIDDTVYNNITKPRVASPYNFPLSTLVPWDTRKKIRSQLSALKWSERKAEEVYHEVETCLIALSERLGESDYFFGSSPTELDALVFGYLFTLLTTTVLTSTQLRNLVKQSSNLLRFCDRLEKQYFSAE